MEIGDLKHFSIGASGTDKSLGLYSANAREKPLL